MNHIGVWYNDLCTWVALSWISIFFSSPTVFKHSGSYADKIRSIGVATPFLLYVLYNKPMWIKRSTLMSCGRFSSKSETKSLFRCHNNLPSSEGYVCFYRLFSSYLSLEFCGFCFGLISLKLRVFIQPRKRRSCFHPIRERVSLNSSHWITSHLVPSYDVYYYAFST